jgi:hypothetical protein
MEKVVIPKFCSEAEEAIWWDTHRSEIEGEVRRRVKQMQLEVTKVSLASSKSASDNGVRPASDKGIRWP